MKNTLIKSSASVRRSTSCYLLLIDRVGNGTGGSGLEHSVASQHYSILRYMFRPRKTFDTVSSHSLHEEWPCKLLSHEASRSEPFKTRAFGLQSYNHVSRLRLVDKVTQIATGLSYLHNLEVVHGDIKAVSSHIFPYAWLSPF